MKIATLTATALIAGLIGFTVPSAQALPLTAAPANLEQVQIEGVTEVGFKKYKRHHRSFSHRRHHRRNFRRGHRSFNNHGFRSHRSHRSFNRHNSFNRGFDGRHHSSNFNRGGHSFRF